MKRTIISLLLLAGLIAVPVMAQDFTSAKSQFISFSFGVPLGYDLASEELTGGGNFGVNFAVVDNLAVGFDFFKGADTAALLRLSYSFSDQFGAAFGFGTSSATSDPVVSLGFFGNFFQNRSDLGIAYSLGLRFDYLADTSELGDGKVLFTIGVSFGL